MSWFESLQNTFYLCFIQEGRFVNFMLKGLDLTLKLTLLSVFIGITFGTLMALVRVTHDKTVATMRPGLGSVLLKAFNWCCKLVITVVRGIPVVVQLMIWFFVIFPASRNVLLIAVLGFAINSAAYVAEIVRAGIMSVEGGQMEAGRSLGLNYIQTMSYIILPQAFKNVLPTLCNEFIVLLKETAVVGYIAGEDLTKNANRLVGLTYEAFMPLMAAALMYLALVMVLSWLFGKLERRLRASDTR